MFDALLLAYLAGIVDGEGSISILPNQWRRKVLGRNPCYSEQVAVGNTNLEVLQLLKETFGGYIGIQKPRSEHRRQFYLWSVGDKGAIKVLDALIPYLRIKKRQAEFCLQLRAIKNRGRNVNTYLSEPVMRPTRWGLRLFRKRFLRPEVLEEYQCLARGCRALNDSRFLDRC